MNHVRVLERIKQHCVEESVRFLSERRLAELSRRSGINYQWYYKFIAGQVKDIGVSRLQRILHTQKVLDKERSKAMQKKNGE